MYYLSVLILMLLAPLSSLAAEHAYFHSAVPLAALAFKWFVFWPVGVRLFIAGLRQLFQPRFTAATIFGIEGSEALPLVREIGMGNIAMGVIGLPSLTAPGFLLPTAVVGGLYYGMAGAGHVFAHTRNTLENTAMISDLAMAAILLGLVAVTQSAAITAAL